MKGIGDDASKGYDSKGIGWHRRPISVDLAAMVSTLEMLLSVGNQLGDLPYVDDPLASITEIIRSEAQTRRAYILTAILHGLATDRKAFSESHIYALGQEVLAVVVRLTHDLLNGRYSRYDLESAVRCRA